jgi:hypothetical protein
MTRLRFALVLGVVILAACLATGMPSVLYAATAVHGPLLQATASPPALEPTPASDVPPSTVAPVGEGTQQALVIVGLVLLSAVLIGGGIYLRQRWMATRY